MSDPKLMAKLCAYTKGDGKRLCGRIVKVLANGEAELRAKGHDRARSVGQTHALYCPKRQHELAVERRRIQSRQWQQLPSQSGSRSQGQLPRQWLCRRVRVPLRELRVEESEPPIAPIRENGAHPRHGWIRLSFVILLGSIVAPSLMFAGLVPFEYRFYILLLSSVGLAIYAWASGYSLAEIGLRPDTLLPALAINISIALAVAAALWLGYTLKLIRAPTIPDWNAFFPLYVLVFCPAQEFSCRSMMFAEFNRLHSIPSPSHQVLLSALVYSFIHVIYHDALTLAATFAIGLVWGLAYWFRPNLLAVSLSHAIVGLYPSRWA